MKKGFTLIELIIYVGLLGIFLMIMTRVFTGITDVQLESESFGAVEEDSRYIFQRISYDIGRATGVIAPINPGDVRDQLILLIDGVATTYSIGSTNLLLTNTNGSNQLNSVGSAISNLTFVRVGASIKMTYTIESTSEDIQGPTSKQITTTIAL